jgi:hypothetical protein
MEGLIGDIPWDIGYNSEKYGNLVADIEGGTQAEGV